MQIIIINMKYVITSVNLTEEEAKKVEALRRKGISLRLLVRYGIEMAENIEKLGESYKNINEIYRKLTDLSTIINTVVNLMPVLEQLKNELNSLRENIADINKKILASSDKLQKYIDLYGEILEKINKQLSNLIKLAVLKEKDIIRQKIEELDRLRLMIIQKYNIPSIDEDVDRMAIELANLRRILNKYDNDENL